MNVAVFGSYIKDNDKLSSEKMLFDVVLIEAFEKGMIDSMAVSYEKSCGALVFRKDRITGKMYILMIRHRRGGHRSFPKGHVEAGETEHETAIREVEEETAVRITIESDFCEKVHYSPVPGVRKEVLYFLAVTDQVEIHPRDGEIADVDWVPVELAERSLTHENDKNVFRAARSRMGI